MRLESLEERALLAVFSGGNLEPSAVTTSPNEPMVWGKSLVGGSSDSHDDKRASSSDSSGGHIAKISGAGIVSGADTGTSSGDVTISPDYLEPSDSKAPRYLGSGDKSYPALTIHSSTDEDWYQWVSSYNGLLTTKILFSHYPGGDIDLQVYNGSGTAVLASSTSTTDNEEVTIGVAAGQSYLIRVYGYEGSVTFYYTLVIDGPDASLAPDQFEDNDTSATATNLGSGDAYFPVLGINAPGDDDWYRWYAHAAGTLRASAFFVHRPGTDIDLQVFNASGTTLIAGSTSTDDNEEVLVDVAAGQSYLIRVYGYQTSVGSYSLDIDGPNILPDIYETNNSASTATNLGTGDQSRFGLTLHTALDQDWYRWLATASGPLIVDVLFTHAVNNNLELQIYNGSGAVLLASSTSTTDNEQAVINVTAGQSYLVRVYSSGSVHHDYGLVINGPEVPNIAPDIFESNNTAATAANLGTGDKSYDGLTIHATDDDDWYRWLAPANGLLKVDVIFTQQEGQDVDLYLYDALGTTILGSSTSFHDNEHVAIDVTAGTSYLIRVYAGSGSVHPGYKLLIDGPAVPILPDAFESNNTAATAANLGTGDKSYDGLTIHAADDDDWYRWLAPANGLLKVDVIFTLEEGQDVDLYLYDGLGTTILGSSTSFHENEHVAIDVTAGTSYLIRVYAGSGSLHPGYNLLIDGPSPILAADFNLDGRVDGNDLLILQTGVGIAGSAQHSSGDADGDGLVGLADFQIWQAEYGLRAGARGQVATGAVQEQRSVQQATIADGGAIGDEVANTFSERRKRISEGLPVGTPLTADSAGLRPDRNSVQFVVPRRPGMLAPLDLVSSARDAANDQHAVDCCFAELADGRPLRSLSF